MPSNRFSNGLEYKWPSVKRLVDVYVEANLEHILEQTRVPDNSDYSNPPEGYNLVNFAVGFSIPTYKKQKVVVDFEINNLLNTKYRDYLNRFRYYTDEMGINYSVKLKITF